ncbi:MAG: hypothetical protein HY686_00430 [Chloroflexi bacterium]|nr:hypothetical protein [Chloroflexota bacterium]
MHFPRPAEERDWGLLDATVPVVRRPENLLIAVCGERGVPFNAVLPGWGYMGGYAVSPGVML